MEIKPDHYLELTQGLLVRFTREKELDMGTKGKKGLEKFAFFVCYTWKKISGIFRYFPHLTYNNWEVSYLFFCRVHMSTHQNIILNKVSFLLALTRWWYAGMLLWIVISKVVYAVTGIWPWKLLLKDMITHMQQHQYMALIEDLQLIREFPPVFGVNNF